MTDTRGKNWIPIKSIFPISYYHLIQSENNFVKVRTYVINPVNSTSVHAHTTTTFIYIILLVSSSDPSLWGGSSCRACLRCRRRGGGRAWVWRRHRWLLSARPRTKPSQGLGHEGPGSCRSWGRFGLATSCRSDSC